MRPKSDAEVADWLRRAATDGMAAEIVSRAGLHDLVCFLCQQAAEKYLKALLVAWERKPPRTHDLPALVEELRVAQARSPAETWPASTTGPQAAQASRTPRPDVGVRDGDAAFLSPFAVTARYPGFGEMDAAASERALGAYRRIRDAVEDSFSASGT